MSEDKSNLSKCKYVKWGALIISCVLIYKACSGITINFGSPQVDKNNKDWSGWYKTKGYDSSLTEIMKEEWEPILTQKGISEIHSRSDKCRDGKGYSSVSGEGCNLLLGGNSFRHYGEVHIFANPFQVYISRDESVSKLAFSDEETEIILNDMQRVVDMCRGGDKSNRSSGRQGMSK